MRTEDKIIWAIRWELYDMLRSSVGPALTFEGSLEIATDGQNKRMMFTRVKFQGRDLCDLYIWSNYIDCCVCSGRPVGSFRLSHLRSLVAYVADLV